MAGRPEGYLTELAERGENLKAILDELADVCRGNPQAERLVALGHDEINDGAKALGVALYPHRFDWDAPVKDARAHTRECELVGAAV